VVDVTSSVTGEVLAGLCTACDAQLPPTLRRLTMGAGVMSGEDIDAALTAFPETP